MRRGRTKAPPKSKKAPHERGWFEDLGAGVNLRPSGYERDERRQTLPTTRTRAGDPICTAVRDSINQYFPCNIINHKSNDGFPARGDRP